MKPTPEQVARFAAADLDPDELADVMTWCAPKGPPEPPPGPFAIALHLAGALIASGKYEDMSAAVSTAWTLVIPFYQGQALYLETGANLFEIAKHASRPEGLRQVGGETGDIGEGGATLGVSVTLDPAVAARWAEIQRTTAAVIAAQAVREEADAALQAWQSEHPDQLAPADLVEASAAAWKTFNDATAEQSKAYE